MSVKLKLYTSYLTIIVLVIIMGVYSIFNMKQINEMSTTISEKNIPRITLSNVLNKAESDFRTLQYMHIIAQTPEEMAQIERLMDSQIKMIDEGLQNYLTITARKESVSSITAKWESFKQDAEQIRNISRQNNTEEAMRLIKADSAKLDVELTNDLTELVNFNVKSAEVASQEGDAAYETANFILTALILIILAISMGIAFYISRYIARFIAEFLRVSMKVSKGDLKDQIQFTARDEFGEMTQSYNDTIVNLKTLLKKIQSTAEQVAASSEELTASADQSAQVTTQIAQSVSEVAESSTKQITAVNTTSAAIEEISASIEEVSANATTSAGQARQAMDTAHEGGASVDKAIEQMGMIEHTVNESADVIAALGDRSKEIGQIVDTISGIAGQTNLLALNAAIEAARAGEHGKGFAVVAEEVRKLAEQSQEAAQQISDLIGKIQSETQQAVTAMQAGTQEVKMGSVVVNESGLAFKKIKDLAAVVANQVENIANTVHEVATGSQEIVVSVKDIDMQTKNVSSETQSVSAATEEQSAAMEQIAASSQNLAKMAQDLQMETRKFSI